jgi:hypothetical protein
MKKILILVIGLFLVMEVSAQKAKEMVDGPQITFAEASHDFGDITQGTKVEYTFKFENTGTEPLILSNVLTTCGCTASSWPREPIAPGKESEITVTFNSAGKMGKQNKVITVVSNGVNPQERVKIVTNVLPAKGETE